MSRISSAKNYPTFHVSGSSAALNASYLAGRERDKSDRDIFVPNQNWKVYRSVWNNTELRRIKTASRAEIQEEGGRYAKTFEADRKRLEWESEQRKQFLHEIDKARDAKSTRKPDDEKDVEKVLNRAFLAKHEDIEEVKRANRIILAAKCLVVRDAQIKEKEEICREQREEELRLERMMLSECDKASTEEKKRQKELKLLNQRYANELRQQSDNRETKKLFEAKRIEEEAKALAKAKVAILNEHLAKQRLKQEKISHIRNELKQSSEMNNFFKHLTYEEQRTAEMKAHEYMRMKREREIQFERDRRLERERKQREADRLLTRQTDFLKMKREQESMAMRRIQEQKEREFRQKEMEAAIKRKETEEHVLRTRRLQIVEMQRIRQIQSTAEKEEHDRARSELKVAEKQRLESKRRMLEFKEKYRNAILSQIEQKRLNKQENQLRTKNENTTQQAQEKLRQQNINCVIAVKLNAMRAAKIPEKVVRDVERQIYSTC